MYSALSDLRTKLESRRTTEALQQSQEASSLGKLSTTASAGGGASTSASEEPNGVLYGVVDIDKISIEDLQQAVDQLAIKADEQYAAETARQ